MIKISEIMTTPPTDERSEAEMKVFGTLDELGIPYERVDNDVVETMEECVEVDRALGAEIRKSVLITNKNKSEFYLLVLPAKKQFDANEFMDQMGCTRPSFATGDQMVKLLGVAPGTAGVMSLMNDTARKVELVLDREVANEEWFACNACDNRSHLKIKTRDLIRVFLPHIKHKPTIIEL